MINQEKTSSQSAEIEDLNLDIVAKIKNQIDTYKAEKDTNQTRIRIDHENGHIFQCPYHRLPESQRKNQPVSYKQQVRPKSVAKPRRDVTSLL